MSRTTFSNTLIASPSLAIGRVGPFDMSLNGQPVVDVFHFFEAALATVLEHGDGPVELEYSVTCLFESEAAMLLFVATHRESLPRQADHVLIDDDEVRALVLADAVRSVSFSQLRGRSCLARYRFIGSQITSEDIPEDLDEDTDRMKLGIVDPIAADVQEVPVVFAAPFGSIPRDVGMVLDTPGGQLPIAVVGVKDVTEAGFTAQLSAITPTGTYKGRWRAIL